MSEQEDMEVPIDLEDYSYPEEEEASVDEGLHDSVLMMECRDKSKGTRNSATLNQLVANYPILSKYSSL